MRVLFDTNIFISYLLIPGQAGVIREIVKAAVLGQFTLLLPEAILFELAQKVEQKPYLANRITAEELHTFATLITAIAEEIPKIEAEIPAVTRDPKDDYLLAYALVGQADYLVSGDDDLLSLIEIEGVKIINPRSFRELLEI